MLDRINKGRVFIPGGLFKQYAELEAWRELARPAPLPQDIIAFDESAFRAARAEESRIATLSDEEFIGACVARRDLPVAETLDAAAKKELETKAAQAAGKLVGTLRLGDSGVPVHDLIDPLYQAWHISRQAGSTTGMADRLKSFETFCAAYVPDNDTYTIGNLITQIDYYMKFVVGERVLDIYYRGEESSAPEVSRYNYAGEWVAIRRLWRTRQYVDKSVIDEVAAIGDSWPDPKGLVFHESGSAALPGIGAENAILSGALAIKRGQSPKTGEFMAHPTFSGVQRSQEERASGTIYASFGMSGGYSTIRWFDEYPVAFGISQQALIALRRRRGFRVPELYETGEGVELGPEVPLELVRVVYVPQNDIPKMKPWVDKHCLPGTQLISNEVAQHYGTIVEKMPELLAKKPTTIPVSPVNT